MRSEVEVLTWGPDKGEPNTEEARSRLGVHRAVPVRLVERCGASVRTYPKEAMGALWLRTRVKCRKRVPWVGELASKPLAQPDARPHPPCTPDGSTGRDPSLDHPAQGAPNDFENTAEVARTLNEFENLYNRSPNRSSGTAPPRPHESARPPQRPDRPRSATRVRRLTATSLMAGTT